MKFNPFRRRDKAKQSRREHDGEPEDIAVALPSPHCRAPTANVRSQSTTQKNVNDGTIASSSTAGPHVSLGAGTREPPQLGRPNTVQHLSTTTSKIEYAQVAVPVPPATGSQTDVLETEAGSEKPPPATQSAAQEAPALSPSQQLWNEAYDGLENDNETTNLVKSYVKTLVKVLGTGTASDTSVEDSDIQLIWKTRASDKCIAQGLGDATEYIMSAKSMIDLAIGNIPQAALPWAGVCIALSILTNLGKVTKSNLTGIRHVVSRMDWYCAFTDHLLNGDSIVHGEKSLESVLQQLKKTVVTLYKALLLYQMKSVCSYYQNKGLVFLRALANLDDWDGDLKSNTDAEDTVRKDSDQYNNESAKSSMRSLLKLSEERKDLLGDIHQTLREDMLTRKKFRIEDKDTECLWKLRVVDPRDDMKKIENKKDKLVNDAYSWIFGTKEYSALTN